MLSNCEYLSIIKPERKKNVKILVQCIYDNRFRNSCDRRFYGYGIVWCFCRVFRHCFGGLAVWLELTGQRRKQMNPYTYIMIGMTVIAVVLYLLHKNGKIQ